MTDREYKFHRYADIFPLMEGEEFQTLVEDIREKGLHETIKLYQDQVLDGRNRYRACPLAGRERRFEEYTGDDPLGYVVSLNIKRRHLDTSQRAMLAASIEEFRWGGARGQDVNLHVDRKRAAEMCSVGESSVAFARVVLDQGVPELQARVRAGELAVSTAAVLCKLPPEKQRKAADLDEDKLVRAAEKIRKHEEYLNKLAEIERQPLVVPPGFFNVIVWDSPFNLQKVAPEIAARNEDRGLPYPVMEPDQIIDFGLKHFFPNIRAADDCALFFWTPDHFLLTESPRIIRAWEFEPVRTHTWHKNTVHNVMAGLPGYNSEFVIYARRGSPRFHTFEGCGFVTCFNGINHGHSRKPDEFYEMIRKVTPGARRIDVFSRSPHEGFEACGNEVDKFPVQEVPSEGRRIFTLEELGL